MTVPRSAPLVYSANRTGVLIQPILGATYNPWVVYSYVEFALMDEADIWLRMFNRATSTWSEKPEFTKIVANRMSRSGYGLITVTLESSSKPWIWVEGGTDRRYGVITTSDYRPKTRPRTIGSGAGAGHVLHVLRKKWVPGIQARDVRFVIAERRRIPFAEKLARRISVGITRSLSGPGSRAIRSQVGGFYGPIPGFGPSGFGFID